MEKLCLLVPSTGRLGQRRSTQPKNQLTSRKCGQEIIVGDPNWHADMLNKPLGTSQPSSFKQKHSLSGFSEGGSNTFCGGVNLK